MYIYANHFTDTRIGAVHVDKFPNRPTYFQYFVRIGFIIMAYVVYEQVYSPKSPFQFDYVLVRAHIYA